ncbi:PaaI family thioesterase [Oceanobacter mangrovi]|uniref:PaaI family thioesterase n=1 Tax=Oceanobacter mangrovi TaxID=2862510 RepID=UPI001C8E8935|nr:PaaI family thioesterase [Oceanobacter mangrovi]
MEQPLINPDWHLLDKCIKEQLTMQPATGSNITQTLKQYIVEAHSGEVVLQFELGDEYTQGNGVLQGGSLSMLLDMGLAFSALTMVAEGQSISTINLQLQFLRPAFCGRLIVRAKVKKPGRKVMFCEASLEDAEGKVLATAESPLLVIDL